MAKEQLELGGGGSYSLYTAAGITHKTPGEWIEHAAVHGYQGPSAKNSEGHLPTTSYQGCDPSAKTAAMIQSGTVSLD